MPFLLVPMELFDVLNCLGGATVAYTGIRVEPPAATRPCQPPGRRWAVARPTPPPAVVTPIPIAHAHSLLSRCLRLSPVAPLSVTRLTCIDSPRFCLSSRHGGFGAVQVRPVRFGGSAVVGWRLVGGGDALLRHGRLCYGSQPTSFRHTLRGSVRHGTLDCSSQATALLVVACWEGERRAHFPGQFIGRLSTPPCLCYDDAARFGAF